VPVKVLVTGGAGYIGSTITSALLDAGHLPVIVDDLSTGAAAFTSGREFVRGDFADPAVLDAVFGAHPDIAAVVHCAARTIVPESVRDPLRYYDNNVGETVRLLQDLHARGCERFVFSSSGSVYAPAGSSAGVSAGSPAGGSVVDEDAPLAQASPYARTKAMAEQVVADAADGTELRAMSLRYFNPIGADPALRSGQQNPAHSAVLSQLVRAHVTGKPFTLTGVDWPTRDGSAIRDYVHVWDVARAHVRALERFDEVLSGEHRHEVLNVGTGRATTVRELIAQFEAVVGASIAVLEAPRRAGDSLGSVAAVDRIERLLGWRAELSIEDAIRDALAWNQRRERVLAAGLV
jgi:UDP-glucose 4-epimerase